MVQGARPGAELEAAPSTAYRRSPSPVPLRFTGEENPAHIPKAWQSPHPTYIAPDTGESAVTEHALKPGFEIHGDAEVLPRVSEADLTDLTHRATAATFYRDGLTPEQIAANQRVVEISGPSCTAAAEAGHQHLAAAFVGADLAGYVIATRHGPDDLELDWLMVDPAFHGSGVAAGLMQAGIAWLGADQPMWLNVIAYNARAIAFYEKFGFAVDPQATTAHAIPHHIMRRRAG